MNFVNPQDEDIVGKKFFKWSVIEKLSKKTKARCSIYLVRCECGEERNKIKAEIVNGTSKGCISCHNKSMNEKKCIENGLKNKGKKFGNWEIIDRIREDDKWKYIGKCSCGKIKKHPQISAFSRFKGCAKCCNKKIGGEKRRRHFINLAKKRIGLTVGSFKILGIEEFKSKLIYMKCKCLFCKKKISIPNGSIPFRESCGCLREANKARGERHYCSKLTKAEVLALRELFDTGLYSVRDISVQFGITINNCYQIISRKSWKHI